MFRVVSFYLPTKGTGYNSAYSQQLRYSMKFNKGICPREILLIDLGGEIIKCKDGGGSIVVMGDWNQDIRTENIVTMHMTSYIRHINKIHNID